MGEKKSGVFTKLKLTYNTYNVCAYGKKGFRAIFTLKESISRLGSSDIFLEEFYALSFESISKSLAPRKMELEPF